MFSDGLFTMATFVPRVCLEAVVITSAGASEWSLLSGLTHLIARTSNSRDNEDRTGGRFDFVSEQ